MSRTAAVCLCAIVALVALLGARLLGPSPVLADDGTVSMETPLHDSPEHGAPLIALLPEGAAVTIQGPPVDGFYPVASGDVTGWMRGETIVVQKDIVESAPVEGAAPEESVELPPSDAANDADLGAAEGSVDPAAAAAPVDSAAVPAEALDPGGGAAEPVVANVPAETTAVEPAPSDPATTAPPPAAETAVASYDPSANPPSAAPAAEAPVAVEPAPAPAPDPAVQDATTVEPAAVDPTTGAPAPTDPVATAPAAVDPTTGEPVTVEPAAPDPAVAVPAPEATVHPATDPNVSPNPYPDAGPTGPASVASDAAIRDGPGPHFGLIFTVPGGSTVEQTGHTIDGYVTVQYKEVTGWIALDQLGAPIAPTQEVVPDEAVNFSAKTSRPGSGVAFTTADLSLRAGPSATEEPVAAVPAGSRVVLTGVMEGGFQRVEFREHLGWIANEYLSTPPDPTPESGRGRGRTDDYSRQQIVRIIYDAADTYNQSRSDMLRVAECESNLDPFAVNPSGSYGLFQFIRTTWKSTPYGSDDVFDPRANANAAGWMWAEGRKSEWVCQ